MTDRFTIRLEVLVVNAEGKVDSDNPLHGHLTDYTSSDLDGMIALLTDLTEVANDAMQIDLDALPWPGKGAAK